MKRLHIIVGAAIAIAVGVGVGTMAPSLVQDVGQYVPVGSDRAFVWREVSGPNGERDPEAVPLYQAVIDGDAGQVKALLLKGAAPDRPLHLGGWSALMAAAELNERDIAKMLIDHGANVNYVSEDAFPTPLDVALTYGVPHQDLSIFHDFLDRGADLNMRYSNGDDIAIHAATNGQMEIVNELLQRGYHSNLPELLQTLNIRQVDDATEPAKQQAITTVKKLLSDHAP